MSAISDALNDAKNEFASLREETKNVVEQIIAKDKAPIEQAAEADALAVIADLRKQIGDLREQLASALAQLEPKAPATVPEAGTTTAPANAIPPTEQVAQKPAADPTSDPGGVPIDDTTPPTEDAWGNPIPNKNPTA